MGMVIIYNSFRQSRLAFQHGLIIGDMFFHKQTHIHLSLSLLCAALLGGCASHRNDEAEQAKAPQRTFLAGTMRLQREKIMQTQWAGKSYTTLTEALGEPAMIMSVPGRNDHSTAKVYGILDEGSQCIDSFTVVTFSGEPIVTNYFCR